MNVRALGWFALYLVVVVVSASVLLESIARNIAAAEQAIVRPTAKDALACEALAHALEEDLFAWYAADVRMLGPEPHKRGPYPGPLAEWEAARRNGLTRCNDAKTSTQLETLLSVRRHLEASSYLLSQTGGKDFALLRE